MAIVTRSVDQTHALGRLIGRLAPEMPETTCIALDGPLGAGKTHLTHGIAEGAGVDDPSLVSSPTYVLLNIYTGKKPVYHLDAYRLSSEDDFEVVGMEELLKGGGLIVVEWARRVSHWLPEDCLWIEIQPGDSGAAGIEGDEDASEAVRNFEITGTGPGSRRLAEAVHAAWTG